MGTEKEFKVGVDLFHEDTLPHVGVVREEVCLEGCEARPCAAVCPAGVFRLVADPLGDGATSPGRLSGVLVEYRRCLECGACLLCCPRDNVFFDYPRSGFGIIHRFG